VERGGFRECRHEDFLPLKAHFLRLMGREADADAALVRQETQPRRLALHNLELACEEADAAAADAGIRFDGRAYAGGFLRNKRHVSIEEADDKALWHACYVLKRKAAGIRKSTGDARAKTQSRKGPELGDLAPLRESSDPQEVIKP
jgi:hypothetical protein